MLAGWRKNTEVRAQTIAALAAAPFPAFFWEMPPLHRDTLALPYECVLLDSPALAGLPPDPSDFADRFAAAPADTIAVFPNLGGDALLIAPCPLGPHAAYGHAAAFFRTAPDAQRHDLLRIIGTVVPTKLTARPLWLSTAGFGVAWLHLRLDTVPKYYRHTSYRDARRAVV